MGASLGGLSESMPYNEYGEPKSYTVAFGGSAVYDLTVERDSSGRIQTKTETIAGVTTTQFFGYDVAGRLTDVTVGGVLESHYDYDANGNRRARSGAAGSASGTYDEQDRIKTYGATTYTFSPNGVLKSKTTPGGPTTYTYDVRGNLRLVTLPSGTLVEYVIDGQSRRVGKKVAGMLVEGLLYGTGLGPLAELDSVGSTVATFVYATKPNVPDYIIKGGKTYRVVTDQVGSVRLVVDAASGTVAQRIDYDEFGIVTNDSNPGFQPFGFAGGLYDRDTGLVRFGARDYDASIGRWTAKDPILFRGGDADLYTYRWNDPVDGADVRGTDPSWRGFGCSMGGAAAGWFVCVPLKNPYVNFTCSMIGSAIGYFACETYPDQPPAPSCDAGCDPTWDSQLIEACLDACYPDRNLTCGGPGNDQPFSPAPFSPAP
jgi:RHS repeat-associated protein